MQAARIMDQPSDDNGNIEDGVRRRQRPSQAQPHAVRAAAAMASNMKLVSRGDLPV